MERRPVRLKRLTPSTRHTVVIEWVAYPAAVNPKIVRSLSEPRKAAATVRITAGRVCDRRGAVAPVP